MRILITGATGFIGTQLCESLLERGDNLCRLARNDSSSINPSDIVWDYSNAQLDVSKLEGFDAIIHLAGENIMGRWTNSKKKAIYNSRIKSTSFLAECLAGLDNKPKVFISASAIGYYGNCGDEVLGELSPVGTGFLADVCRDWESACKKAQDSGIKVANLRISMVLGSSGGPLAKMEPIFKLGLGGRLGSGRQWMSWVTIEDLVRVILFVLDNDISGPLNVCSSNPVRNTDFTRTLAKVVNRPAIMPVPAFMLRLLYGQLAEEVLLSSARVLPVRLIDAGFEFNYPDLESALVKNIKKHQN